MDALLNAGCSFPNPTYCQYWWGGVGRDGGVGGGGGGDGGMGGGMLG